MKSNTAVTKSRRPSLPADVKLSGTREVNGYLRRHPDMSSIVPAMCVKAREVFSTDAELTLQVSHDLEMDDPYLILYVRLPAYDPDTRKRIDAVWRQFEEDLCDLSGWIILTTDFRKVQGHAV